MDEERRLPKTGYSVPTLANLFGAADPATVDPVQRKAIASPPYQLPPRKRTIVLLPRHCPFIELL